MFTDERKNNIAHRKNMPWYPHLTEFSLSFQSCYCIIRTKIGSVVPVLSLKGRSRIDTSMNHMSVRIDSSTFVLKGLDPLRKKCFGRNASTTTYTDAQDTFMCFFQLAAGWKCRAGEALHHEGAARRRRSRGQTREDGEGVWWMTDESSRCLPLAVLYCCTVQVAWF